MLPSVVLSFIQVTFDVSEEYWVEYLMRSFDISVCKVALHRRIAVSRPHPLRHRASRPHMYVVRLHHHFKTAVAVQVTTPMGQYQDGHVGWRLQLPQNVLLWLLRLHHHF
jgi:hypothetical protein